MEDYKGPEMCVKIDISMKNYPGQPEAVIYYRYKMPMHLALRWEWYFNYLASLVKVHNPKRRVNLTIVRQDECICGEEYINERKTSLIQGKKRNITRIYNQPFTDDLFNIARAERDAKIEKIQGEIDALERGEFNYYVPPVYVNRIKEYLKNGNK